MPIARINPDGTVRIYNANTGEVKDVSPEELGQYNPKLVGDYYKLASEQEKTTKEAGVKEEKLTATQQQNQNLAKSGLRALKTVQEEIGKDQTILTKQLTPGKFQSRKFDSALFNAINSLLRIQTGATAPEEEVRRYMSSLGPNFGDDPQAISFKIEQLATDLSEQGYLKPEEDDKLFPKQVQQTGPSQPTTGSVVQSPAFQRAQQNNQPQMNPLERLLNPVAQGPVGAGAETLLGLFAPGVKKVAQADARRQPVSLGQGVEAAGDIAATALPFLRVGKLGLAAKGALAGGISGVTQEAQNVGDRLKSAGLQGVLGGVLGGIPQGLGAIGNNLSFKAIGKGKRAAKEKLDKTLRFSGEEIAQAGRKYVETDELADSIARKVLPKLEKKNFTIDELEKKLDVWGKAYTAAKETRVTEKAGLYDALYGKARQLIRERVPEVSKQIDKASRLHDIRRTTRRILPFAAGGVGLGAGGNILADLLLGGRR